MAQETVKQLLARLRRAQKRFIERRTIAESNGEGGASRIPPAVIAGGYYVSYNGRVWKGEPGKSADLANLILEADGSEYHDDDRLIASWEKAQRLREAAPDLARALQQLLVEVDAMTRRVGWAGNGGRLMAREALKKAGML